MERYLERVMENIRPLSVEQDDVKIALKEWQYTGRMQRADEASEICQLCDHEDLRDQYEIQNRHTRRKLLVGSKCIERFELPVYDKETRAYVTGKAASSVLQRDRREVLAEEVRRTVIDALKELIEKELDAAFAKKVRSLLSTYQREGAFSPKQLNLLLWRFKTCGVAAPPGLKITLRSDADKTQIQQMEDWMFDKLKGFLSSEQLDRALELRQRKK